MSYSTPPTTQTARKQHVCDWCLQAIVIGERYKRWAYYDDTCSTNRMHLECVKAAQEDAFSGEFEYVRGEGERPEERLGFAPAHPDAGQAAGETK